MKELTEEEIEARIQQIDELFKSLEKASGTLHEQFLKRLKTIEEIKQLDPDMSIRAQRLIRSIKAMPKLDWEHDSFNRYFETYQEE